MFAFYKDSVGILKIDKNKTPDPTIISKSYLQYLVEDVLPQSTKDANFQQYHEIKFIKMKKIRGDVAMKNELLNFIENLTPEQVDKLITHLPRLTSLLSESCQLSPREQTLQNR